VAHTSETNRKDLLVDTIRLANPGARPAVPHWWGLYKYEALGLDYRTAAWQEGDRLAAVYRDFYAKFAPDWFHLHLGTPKYFQNSRIVSRDGRPRLVIDPSHRSLKAEDKYFCVGSAEDEEIVDFPDYLLASRVRRPKVDLDSRSAIDEFVRRYVHMSAEEILALGYTDHVRSIAESHGRSAFLAVHIPSAVCEIFDPTTGYLGFEDGLMAFRQRPAEMSYLLAKCYEEQLEWAQAYRQAGADAYIISECYVSPETVGPQTYRDFLKPIHRDYFAEVERMGLTPMCMFLGDVNPIIEDLTQVNIRALLIEESKKGFVLDIGRIARRIADRLCLFGNLDSIRLLHDGRPQQIAEEVRAQIVDGGRGFVVSNGSPITPGTPEANVRALIEAAGCHPVDRSSGSGDGL
jgi:hypothetical protein